MEIKKADRVCLSFSVLFFNEAERRKRAIHLNEGKLVRGKRKITASRSGNICEITSPVAGGRQRKWEKLQELCKRREKFKRDERAGGFTASQSL